jgi:hypothetical protein
LDLSVGLFTKTELVVEDSIDFRDVVDQSCPFPDRFLGVRATQPKSALIETGKENSWLGAKCSQTIFFPGTGAIWMFQNEVPVMLPLVIGKLGAEGQKSSRLL